MKTRPPPSPPLELDESISDESCLTRAILQDKLALARCLFKRGVRPGEISDGNSEPHLIDLIAMDGSVEMLRLLLSAGIVPDVDTLRRTACFEAPPERLRFLSRYLHVDTTTRKQLRQARNSDNRYLIVCDWLERRRPLVAT